MKKSLHDLSGKYFVEFFGQKFSRTSPSFIELDALIKSEDTVTFIVAGKYICKYNAEDKFIENGNPKVATNR